MSEVIKSTVLLEVVEETKNYQNGPVVVKAVSFDNKTWIVGKFDFDKVEAGKEYLFNLSKSEYNDKIYYWANLCNTKESPVTKEKTQESSNGDLLLSYFKSLDKENQLKALKVLLDLVK